MRVPAGAFGLGRDEVHVWYVDLDRWAPPGRTGRGGARRGPSCDFWELLSDDEKARAGRLRSREGSRRFVTGRALLRLLLGAYLEEDAGREGGHAGGAGDGSGWVDLRAARIVERARGLRFEYGPRGKPALGGDDAGGSALTFNLSHSHGLAVYAVARGRQVGLDVERIRPGIKHELLAVRFFSPREAAALLAMPDRLRLRAFYACWTRKEAFIKARGEGFALSLRRFSVSVDPDRTPVLDDVEGAPGEVLRWTLCDLEPGPKYAGALAVEGRRWRLRSRRLGSCRLGP